MKEHVNKHYGTSFHQRLSGLPCRLIVAYSLFGWAVKRETVLGNGGSITVEELKTKGIVFCHHNQKIVFPSILLLNTAVTAISSELLMLLQNFDVMLNSEESEQNSLTPISMKIAAFIDSGTKAEVSQILPLPLNSHLHDLAVDKSTRIVSLPKRVDLEFWKDWHAKITKMSDSAFFLNAEGALFADGIIGDSNGIVIWIQDKQNETAKEKARTRQKIAD